MPETKSQKMLCLQEEEARLEREEDENDKAEREPQDKADEDPTGPGGADDDNPEKIEAIKHTTKLGKDFETLL